MKERLERIYKSLAVGSDNYKQTAVFDVSMMLCGYASNKFADSIENLYRTGKIRTPRDLHECLQETIMYSVDRHIERHDNFREIMKLVVRYYGGNQQKTLDKRNDGYMIFVEKTADNLETILLK